MASTHLLRFRRAGAVCLTALTVSGCQLAHWGPLAELGLWSSERPAEVAGEAPPPLLAEPVRYHPIPARRVPDAAPTPAIVEVPVYVPAPRTFFDVDDERQEGARRIAAAGKGAATHDPGAAVRTAREGRFLNASLVQPFIDSMIYQVIVQAGRLTSIRLEPGEEITSLEASDSSSVQLASSQVGSGSSLARVIVLKPNDAFESNNLQIVTTRRLYLLDLVMADPGSEAYHRLVTWTHATLQLPLASRQHLPGQHQPELYDPGHQWLGNSDAVWQTPAVDPGAGPRLASASRGLPPPAARLWELNFGYAVSGPEVPWKPVTVYDDGAKTVIRFRPEILARKAPALFVIDLDDRVQALNYRVRGATYVVDGLFDRAALQLGQDRRALVTIERSGIWNDPTTVGPITAGPTTTSPTNDGPTIHGWLEPATATLEAP